ncbi:hypothetical protein CNR34_00095 [Pseudomonas phage nickie]|uniref:Uncharacterized protein n=1 Tax=Pseudomonas phage nickie TaxID=2048977 RepID=A0A2H4P781_9CAUD|nr:hypothetical protein FDJ16_gp070 [Pseudomonas phage nickie]ATW58028.1 hypothetical protein CNR34_00095 [Pseudomonas phage nickie]
MAIEIKIDDAVIQKLADDAVQRAVKSTVENSSVIKQAVEKAIAGVKIDTKQIEDAVVQSIKNVTSSPAFLDDLIRQAIMKGAPKLTGSFDASLRAAGKRMALDPETLEQLIEGVKHKLTAEAEERRAEMEIKGMGAFA